MPGGVARAAAALVLAGQAAAILVADGSPCDTLCGNVLDATTTEDVVCDQDEYATDDAGIVFQQCANCELTSGFHTPSNETDAQWMLYNLRYAVSYCLFGVPNADETHDNPCITSKACEPFRDAIVYKNMSSNIEEFEYCDTWPVEDTESFSGCTECLRSPGTENEYLANYVTVLQAGCEQRPVPGVTVAIEGNVFSTDYVNVTAPTPTATVNPEWFDHGALGLGGKVGIAIGGFVVLLLIVGCGIVWNGKRRRRAYLRTVEARAGNTKGWPSTPAPLTINHEMNQTPLSQKPLRGWDDSPMSARSDSTFPRYFSPYSSQFNSPVSANEAPMPNWPVMGHSPMPGQGMGPESIGMALGGAGGGLSDNVNSKGKSAQEAYEMQHVDGHYGGDGRHYEQHQSSPYQQQGHFPAQYGEAQPYPPNHGGMAEEHLRR